MTYLGAGVEAMTEAMQMPGCSDNSQKHIPKPAVPLTSVIAGVTIGGTYYTVATQNGHSKNS